ncbi:hypothetical protein [Flavobacterium sp.]|jgi:hypothetical protein|uniref:hypothetical protein n=1 Tax=Flavobacterium sp. TaxID=239 RepID=UPI0037C13DEC
MKKFGSYIGYFFMLVIASLYLVDFLYTEAYKRGIPRNKARYTLLLKNQTFDYVFMGSSRVENSISTQEIERITQKRAINLGTQGADFDDVYLFLKLLVANNNNLKNVFVQIDGSYVNQIDSQILKSQLIPYVSSNDVLEEHMKLNEKDFYKLKYIPFYKYAKSDYSVGFREVFMTLLQKKSNIAFDDGFVPLDGYMNSDSSARFPNTIKQNNKAVDEISKLCQGNKINLLFFCAPYCSNVENKHFTKLLENKLPNFKDYSGSFTNDSLFRDCSHLNEKGALKFTALFAQENLKESK